jgi:hypothetical protein
VVVVVLVLVEVVGSGRAVTVRDRLVWRPAALVATRT